MNIGVYLRTLSDNNQLMHISTFINHCLELDYVKDASVFYDDVGPNPFKINSGMFNSADLWNFNGVLISTSLECLISSNKIVNNIRPYYYYGWENVKPSILDILDNINHATIICKNDDQKKYLERVLGNKKEIIISDNFHGLSRIIKESLV